MITNPSSSAGSQGKNSISLVFVDIRIEVIYFGRKYPLMMMMKMI